MKIEKINQTTQMQIRNAKTQTMPFKGNFIEKVFKHDTNMKMLKNFRSDMMAYFDLSSKDLEVIDKSFTPNEPARLNLLFALGRKHRASRFAFRNQNYNDSNFESISAMVKNAKNLTSGHLRLVNHSDYTFPQLNNLFNEMNESPLKAQMVRKLMLASKNSGYNLKYTYQTMSDLINSKYLTEFNDNFYDYLPYIKLNIKDSNMPSKLEKEIEQGTYDVEKYAKLEKVENLLKNSHCFVDLPYNTVFQNYSQESLDILKSFDELIIRTEVKNHEKLKQIGISLLESTNNDNYENRIEFINNFLKSNPGRISSNQADISAIPVLVSKMDRNKEDANFIKKVIDKKIIINNTSELLKLIETVGSEKLNSNISTVKTVLKRYQYSPSDKKIKILLENIDQNSFTKFKQGVKNILGIN